MRIAFRFTENDERGKKHDRELGARGYIEAMEFPLETVFLRVGAALVLIQRYLTSIFGLEATSIWLRFVMERGRSWLCT